MIDRVRRYPPEVIVDKIARRVRETLRRAADVSAIGEGLGATISIPPVDQRAARSMFHLDPLRRDAMVETLARHWPPERRRVVEAADEIMAGRLHVLGHAARIPADASDWHRDPATGFQWPDGPARGIDYLNVEPKVDVKRVWEINRQQWLFPVGQAFWLTGDRRYADATVACVSSWIDANPLGRGVNWAMPMEAALRLVSWSWAFHFLSVEDVVRPEMQAVWLRSILEHARFVGENLEYTPRNGNHLVADALGLLYAGAAFPWLDGADARRRRGVDILSRAIVEQTYADGLDYEGSSAYHRFVGEMAIDALFLARLSGTPFDRDAATRIQAMSRVSDAMMWPDGHGPGFGDDDSGFVWRLGERSADDHRPFVALASIALGTTRPADLTMPVEALWLLGPTAPDLWSALIESPRGTSVAFPRSGLYVVASRGTRIVIDASPLGMGDGGYGGHGHLDALNVALSIGGRRILLDSGTYAYTGDEGWRNALRGEAAHNTIRVDGVDSVAQIDTWRLGESRRPFVRAWMNGPGRDLFVGEKTGSLPDGGTFRHRRRIYLDDRGCALIVDDILGAGHHVVERFFQLPAGDMRRDGVRFVLDDVTLICLSSDSTTLNVVVGDPRSRVGWRSPAYGVLVATPTIVERYEGSLPTRLVALITGERVTEVRLTDDGAVEIERSGGVDVISLPPLTETA
ncbi:MAG: alginate lyase family protein [Chloroflexota bacterium]|nr:MAG: alginate lyase family protein [Chloroflexota bacterium]